MKYTASLQVRSYEIGADGGLQHGDAARFVLHAGSLVTQALGLDQSWYEQHGTGFVVRGLRLEFASPAREDEVLRLQTWLSDAGRVRGLREVAITSEADGRPIANAQLEWVYINRATLAPARMPAEAIARVSVSPERACALAWAAGDALGDAAVQERRVEKRELDGLGHVNTAVYVEWCEQAWCEVTGGEPRDIRGHQLHFQRSARDGDTVRILTQQTAGGVWRQTIALAGGETLVTNLCLAALDR